MRITKLWLINFRNHENTTINFSDRNIILGPNGAGKTNILEAIDILATTKSKIVKGINKCIRNQQKGFIISGEFVKDNGEVVKVVFKQERDASRTIKVNEKTLTTSSELIGRVNSVVFLPNDIEIIQGSPQARRKYLDILISQIEPAYYQALKEYQKVLKQRNETLKLIKEKKQTVELLEPWEQKFLELNQRIFFKRREYLEILSKEIAGEYLKMGYREKLFIEYHSEVSAEMKENESKLRKSREFDIMTGRSNFGIQRDDLLFRIATNEVMDYCSQGQQRLISLSLKLAEARIKQEKLADNPLLLIDDVLLELDIERFNKIIKETFAPGQQVYTVTDTKRFEQGSLAQIKTIVLDRGMVVNG